MNRLHLALLLGLFSLIALLAATRISDPDTMQYLASGRHMLGHGLERGCVFTYASDQCQIVMPQWLFHVMVYALYLAGGWSGLVAFQVLVALGIFGIIVAEERRRGTHPLTVVPLILLAAMVARERFFLRADFFALVPAVLLYYLLERYWDRDPAPASPRALLAAMAGVQILWVNTHGSFPIAFVLLGAFLADSLLGRLRRVAGRPRDRTRRGPEPAGLLAVSAVILVSSLLNPYGLESFLQPFRFALGGESMAPQTEFFSPFAPSDLEHLTVAAYKVLLGVLIAALVLGVKAIRARDLLILGPLLYLSISGMRFIALFAVFCAILLPRYLEAARAAIAGLASARMRAARPGSARARIAAGAGSPGMRSSGPRSPGTRTAPPGRGLARRSPAEGVPACTPSAEGGPPGLDGGRPASGSGRPRMAEIVVSVLLFALMTGIGYAAATDGLYRFDALSRRTGFGLSDLVFPEAAASFIEANDLPGNMFNDYSLGTYLNWRLFPGRRTFIDGHTYTPERLAEYRRIMAGVTPHPGVVEKYGINYFILGHRSAEARSLIGALMRDPDWALVHFDEMAMIFLRRVPANRTIIEHHAIDLRSPANAWPRELSNITHRADRYLGHTDMGLILSSLGLGDAALAELQEAARENPGSFVTQTALGLALDASGATPRGIEACRSAVRLRSGYAPAHLWLGYLLLRGKSPAAAAPELERALAINPRSPQGHLFLGMAFEGMGDRRRALEEYRKEAEADPSSRPAKAAIRRLG